MSDTSDIANFYRGKSVFITGATGFMGKVLVEKLLRSCPGITNIYILMRPKKGNDVKTRLMELVNTMIFDWVRKERPETLSKIIPIPGDITSPELGISQSDRNLLKKNVSIVFHSAATVKFDEPLKISVNMNMLGTKRLVELCQQIENLEALVHVSTAYCNCDRDEVNELIYPPPADPDQIMKCMECMDEELIQNVTPYLIRSRPNTYTFTKALAEHIFIKECAGIPSAIVRPSIVTAAWKEPVTGWVDNLNGPTGILAGAGKGILRTLLCYRDLIADIMPVDIAINLLITVAWHTAVTRPNNVLVYNCTSGGLNPLRWGEIEAHGHVALTTQPFNDVFWYPGGSFKHFRLVDNICKAIFHIIPAYVIDMAARVTGKKPVMVRIQQKFQKAIAVLEYFTTHEWKFHSTNVTRLFSKLNDHDKKIFNFNVKEVDWIKYIQNYVLGIRLYILKEDPNSDHKAKIRLRKMYILHKMTQILSLLLLTRFILLRSNLAKRMWYLLMSTSFYVTRFLTAPIMN